MIEIETLTTWRPSVPAGAEQARAASHHKLGQAIEQEERLIGQRHPELVHSQRRGRSVAVTVASVAIVLMVLVSVIGMGIITAPLGPDLAAASALNDAAQAADAIYATIAEGPILDADEYVYAISKGTQLHVSAVGDSVYSALVPFDREVWIAADGSGRLIQIYGEPEFLTELDQKLWEAAGRRPIARSVDHVFGPGGFVAADLATLPTEPEELARYLTDEAAGSPKPIEAALFDRIRGLLSESDLVPGLQVALYRVAATINGIELLADVFDRAGRPGVAVGLTYTYSGIERRSVLIFDPSTGELLGTESIILSYSPEIRAPLPVTIGYVTYGASEIVDHIPDQ